MAGSRFEELPAVGLWREELETPLFGKQERESTDVGVLEMAYVGERAGIVVLWVVQEDERRERGPRVGVIGLEAGGAGKA